MQKHIMPFLERTSNLEIFFINMSVQTSLRASRLIS